MITAWTGAYCRFAGEAFLKTGKSVIALKRALHAHLIENSYSYELKILYLTVQFQCNMKMKLPLKLT